MNFFFDTYAIICLIDGDENYIDYKDYVITTSIFNLAELYNILLKENDKRTARYWMRVLNFEILELDNESLFDAVEFRRINRKKKMSLTDCVGYILAKQNNIKFLTGDKEFKDLKNVEFVRRS